MIIFIGLLLLILHISIIILVQAYSQQVCTPDEPSFCYQVDGQQRRGKNKLGVFFASFAARHTKESKQL